MQSARTGSAWPGVSRFRGQRRPSQHLALAFSSRSSQDEPPPAVLRVPKSTMSEVQIGFATADDAEAIAVLNRELLAFYEIAPPGPIPAVAEQIRRHGIGPPPGVEILLARRWSELV